MVLTDGGAAELLLDAKELVELGGALAAARGASLDLAGAEAHDEVRDERVLGLARAVPERAPVKLGMTSGRKHQLASNKQGTTVEDTTRRVGWPPSAEKQREMALI